MKATPHEHDHGPTAERAVRPSAIGDIPEAHQQSAEDLRSGWIAKFAKTQTARSRFDEVPGEAGAIAERLELAFDRWRAEMERQKLPVWPALLVVCHGHGALEASRLKKADPRIIEHLVVVALLTYELHAS